MLPWPSCGTYRRHHLDGKCSKTSGSCRDDVHHLWRLIANTDKCPRICHTPYKIGSKLLAFVKIERSGSGRPLVQHRDLSLSLRSLQAQKEISFKEQRKRRLFMM